MILGEAEERKKFPPLSLIYSRSKIDLAYSYVGVHN
jgi:hypothetical protein